MLDLAHVWLPWAAVMAAIIAVSGFFSGSETALFFLSPDEVARFRSGTRRQQLVGDLLQNPERLLTAILFWNLVANLLYFTVGLLAAKRISAAGSDVVAGLFNLGALVALIVFGEVLPKSFAVAAGARLASFVSLPLAAAVRLLDPILPWLATAAAAIRRVIAPRLSPEPYLRTHDLDRAAALAGPVPAIDADDARVFRNVIDLLETNAEDLMRPRTTFRPLGRRTVGGRETPLFLAGQVVTLTTEAGEDLAAPAHAAAAETIDATAFRPVTYVPWCAPAASAIDPLRSRSGIAVGVVNEYGDLIGLITREDVLESLVNPRASRAARVLDREPVVRVGRNAYRVDGITLLRVLDERLGLPELPEADADVESRTVAGLLHERLGRFAELEDTAEWRGHELRVVETTGRNDVTVLVTPAEGGGA